MPPPKGLTFDTPCVYRIGVQGYLDESWSDRMQGADIRVQDLPDEAPVTLLIGHFIDQAALAGVLNTLYDLGFPLLTVELLEARPLRKARTRWAKRSENAHPTTHLERRHPMTLGPIDFIALEFPGNRFKGEILPDLLELVDQGIIRIIDLVIIMKDQGQVVVRELRELDAAHIALFNPLKVEVSQMITRTDIDMIAEKLADNSTAGLMLIENLWANKTKQAMLDANGRLVMFERIPHDVVEEALADIAALATAEA